jgi:hypothetical protein
MDTPTSYDKILIQTAFLVIEVLEHATMGTIGDLSILGIEKKTDEKVLSLSSDDIFNVLKNKYHYRYASKELIEKVINGGYPIYNICTVNGVVDKYYRFPVHLNKLFP